MLFDTLVNGIKSIYQAILGAVGLMPEIQVVLAKGSNIELADLGVSSQRRINEGPAIQLLPGKGDGLAACIVEEAAGVVKFRRPRNAW